MKLPDKFINWTLVSEPMNWAVVFAVASIWLIFFHVVMKGFGAMQGQPAFGSPAPGMIAAPTASNTGIFSQLGKMAFGESGGAHVRGNTTDGYGFWGGGVQVGDGTWIDDIEAKYAEDGWVAN